MQTPALFKPMNLGEGFDFDFSDSDYSSSDYSAYPETSLIDKSEFADVEIPFVDYSLDLTMNDSVVVDMSGDVTTESGDFLITGIDITNIANNNPGREAEAIARELQITSPDWAKQFGNTDQLVRAAAGLYRTVKAVVTGKPIPPSTLTPNRLPAAYGSGFYNKPINQTGLNNTNMLLIGGAALAAFLVLRGK